MTTRPIRAALVFATLLYAATAAPANAEGLDPGERAELAALREGTLSKLVVHESPRPPLEPAFIDGEGESVTLADFRGKVVLVNFWATWCPPCVKEMPALDALAAEMTGGSFEVVTVSTDFGGLEKPRRFLEEKELGSLALYLDADRALARAAGVKGLPVTLLLDREGREVARLMGDAHWDGAPAKAIVERLIEMTAPGAG